MTTPREDTLDTFDRVIGTLHGLPDILASRDTTITEALPIVGRVQTYVVRTYRSREGRFTVCLQTVDAEGRARIVIPPKVVAAMYRQREQLVTRARRQTGKAVWEDRRRGLDARMVGDGQRALRVNELRERLGLAGLTTDELAELKALEREVAK